MDIQYRLDESIPNAIANGLRLRSINVTTTKDAGLLEASDSQQLAYAHENHRVIASFDDDFLVLACRGAKHCGIAYCHQRERSIGQVINGLMSLWRQRTAEEMIGQIHFL
jgi:predicted nuclease of predicted toxin-antitoxin system